MEHGFHAGESNVENVLQKHYKPRLEKIPLKMRKCFVDICCEQSAALEDYTLTNVCGMFPAHEDRGRKWPLKQRSESGMGKCFCMISAVQQHFQGQGSVTRTVEGMQLW